MDAEILTLSPEESWLTDLAQGAVTGATTGAVAGPWGALIGAIAGAGLSALQSASAGGPRPATPPPPARPSPAPPPAAAQPAAPAAATAQPRVTSLGRVATTSPSAGSSQRLDLDRLLPAILSLAQALSTQTQTAQALPGQTASETSPTKEDEQVAAPPRVREDDGGTEAAPVVRPSIRYAEAAEAFAPFQERVAPPATLSPGRANEAMASSDRRQ